MIHPAKPLPGDISGPSASRLRFSDYLGLCLINIEANGAVTYSWSYALRRSHVNLTLADPHRLPTLYFQLLAVSLSLVHLLVDWAKVSLDQVSSDTPTMPSRSYWIKASISVIVIGAVFLLVHPSLQRLFMVESNAPSPGKHSSW